MADFYLDDNIAIDLARELRSWGHTATTARDQGLDGADDDEHLLVAAQRGWTLLTNNRKDFILLHGAWRRWASAWQVPARHAGILILRQEWPPRQAAKEVDSFIKTGGPLGNQLYVWYPSSGWVSR